MRNKHNNGCWNSNARDLYLKNKKKHEGLSDENGSKVGSGSEVVSCHAMSVPYHVVSAGSGLGQTHIG